ncbi:MAG: lipoprotein [Deltaproteobacteria bacterium]|nr:lipoprotein [Deltaproteobacteria bacterium]
MKNVARKTGILFALILLFVAGTAYSAGVDMKEGDWEISSETSMTMEGMSMPSMANKSTYCLTREDPVPKSEQDKDCRIVKQKVVGNTVSWRMECKKGEGEGEISYHGTTYNGFLKMKMVEDGHAMNMNVKLAGKYLGPCPKGQKSGPTGETAMQMAAGQQAVAQAQRQQAEMQAEQAANAKKGEAFMKRAVVPAEEPGACAQKGCSRTPECEKKIGELNLKPGDYEITIEQASRIGTTYTPVKVERKTVFLDEANPVPGALPCGRAAYVKWGRERITWTDTPGGGASKGGILRMLSEVIPSAHAVAGVTMGGVSYRGNSFEGAVTNTMDFGKDQQSLDVTYISGRRVGDGKLSTGRGYSAKKPVGDSGNVENKILKDPVKGIRNLFGF